MMLLMSTRFSDGGDLEDDDIVMVVSRYVMQSSLPHCVLTWLTYSGKNLELEEEEEEEEVTPTPVK